MTKINPHRRLNCLNYEFSIELETGTPQPPGTTLPKHQIIASLAYDQKTGELREMAFVGRGKIGHGIDHMLRELGIKVSRAIQGRDPDSGAS